MSCKINYKGTNKTLKITEIPDLQKLRQKIQKVFKLDFDTFSLKYRSEDENVFDLSDQGEFIALKQHEKVKIFVLGPGDKLDESIISKQAGKSLSIPAQEKLEKAWSKPEHSEAKPAEKKEEQQSVSAAPTKQAPQKLMLKLGDKQIVPFGKQKANEDQVYFACKVCKLLWSDGTRYRCTTCIDFDLCHTCYSKNQHPEKDHEFIWIESKAHWQGFDFLPLLEALIDPYFSWTEPDLKKEKFTQKDIMTCSDKFEKWMTKQLKYYSRRFDEYPQLWFNRFDEIAIEKLEAKEEEEKAEKERNEKEGILPEEMIASKEVYKAKTYKY